LDLKIAGISEEIIRATLQQSREARMEILRKMLTAIFRPRAEISPWAPRLLRTKIDPEKIGLLIGPGGKMIRAIQEQSGAQIDVEDDGTVTIACSSAEGARQAMNQVEALTASVEVGRVYEGRVTSVKDFGAFIEILPGKDGLCHISELSDEYVSSVGDVCKVGDVLQVKVIAIDDQDRVKLSRKVLLREQKGEAPQQSSDGGGRGRRERVASGEWRVVRAGPCRPGWAPGNQGSFVSRLTPPLPSGEGRGEGKLRENSAPGVICSR
jgi:polyribonucleotide nucleotidyltransferase